jgi:hypothetical protein
MNGRGARSKGARGENELAQMMSDELGFIVKRKLGQARDGGDDIQVGKFRIEVKRREALRLDDWCEQIEKVCGPSEVPIVAYRRNNQPWRAVVPMAWLISQIREDYDK